MAAFDPSTLRGTLAALRAADPEFRAFGAGAHRYELEPVLSEAEVAAAETQFGVEFPDEYRRFLLEAGAGGAGPYYGIFPLRFDGARWGWVGDGASDHDFAAPFRFEAAWNLNGHEIWKQEPYEEDFDDFDAYEDAREQWNEEFRAVYWDYKWLDGAITICHEGCALRDVLVVSGPERGKVWWDGMSDMLGLMPCRGTGEDHLTFGEWYMQWVDRVERFTRGEDIRW